MPQLPRTRSATHPDQGERAITGGHDAGWDLVARFDVAKNDAAALDAEYALALLADHFPSRAFAIRGLAPHILEHRLGSEWSCCSAIDR